MKELPFKLDASYLLLDDEESLLFENNFEHPIEALYEIFPQIIAFSKYRLTILFYFLYLYMNN
jgi:hypothetical protein